MQYYVKLVNHLFITWLHNMFTIIIVYGPTVMEVIFYSLMRHNNKTKSKQKITKK